MTPEGYWSRSAPEPPIDSALLQLEVRKAELDARQERMLRQSNSTSWIMIIVGLSVVLLNLPVTIGLGAATILSDYRLLFLVAFSFLAGLGLLAYAFYYRRTTVASVYEDMKLGQKRLDADLEHLMSVRRYQKEISTFEDLPFRRWRGEADDEGGWDDDART